MFYSHQILARKGPLATVWIAAHLEKRLNKSQINATDIVSTVDRIMCPEAPIALRMSGHLLLGVVRIYSRKVDYVYHDSGVISKGLYVRVVDLPENAVTAPSEAITMPPPQGYALDEMDLDDCIINDDGYEDRFCRNQEEITLPDQIPVDNNFTVFPYDELMMDPTQQEAAPNSGDGIPENDDSFLPQIPVADNVVSQNPIQIEQVETTTEWTNAGFDSDVRPMEEDITPLLPLDTNVGIQDPGPTNQTVSVNTGMANSPQSIPEIEVMRDAVHDSEAIEIPALFEFQDNLNEPQRVTSPNHVMNEKEVLSPPLEDILHSGGQSSLLRKHSEGPVSGTSANVPEIFDAHVSFGHASVDLALRSSPPVEQQQPKPRARKRKQIDETIVLKNLFMKKALQDTGDISRKRKPVPVSILGDWKLRTQRKKEQIFDEPSIIAICPDLHDIFTRDLIIAKPHLVISQPMAPQSPHPDVNMDFEHEVAVQSPVRAPSLDKNTETENQVSGQSPVRAPDTDKNPVHVSGADSPACSYLGMDFEVLRDNVENTDSNVYRELMPSPRGFMGSPVRRNDDFTHVSADYLGTDGRGGTSIGTTVISTPSMTASTVPYGSEMETPLTFLKERSGLSDIPELINSAEAEGLNFLEEDNTPTSSQGTQNVDGLSVRTRAVAQFLKSQSPVAQVPENPTEGLSLNKILEGKTKKICARMFYETLVLRSYGLVDAHQQDPYGDITLKLTPKLKAL